MKASRGWWFNKAAAFALAEQHDLAYTYKQSYSCILGLLGDNKLPFLSTFRQVSWTMDKYDLQAIGIPQEQAKQILKILFDPLYSSAKHDFLFYFGGRSCIRTTFQQHIFPCYRLEAFEVLHNNFSAPQRFWHRSLLVMYLLQRRKVRRR